MPRAPSIFRETDVTRLLRAARKAGYTVDKAVISRTTGDIVLVFGGTEVKLSEIDRNPWDEVLTHAADKERPA
jgi:hypothetical protein